MSSGDAHGIAEVNAAALFLRRQRIQAAERFGRADSQFCTNVREFPPFELTDLGGIEFLQRLRAAQIA